MAAVAAGAQVPGRPVDFEALKRIGRELLIAIGQDPENPNVRDTPTRWAKWWREFIEYDAGKTDTAFESNTSGELVTVSGIRVWSLCEHHLLPFNCDISIGYVPDGKILGLSKFARIAHKFAHRPQVQERLVQQIADEVTKLTGSEHVAVVGKGEHLCMVMRGVKTPGKMSTATMRGLFKENDSIRQQFFHLTEK